MDNQDDIHSFECDNCEKRTADYHCKTCYGHLCKDCKMVHESKRLTRGHSVILLSEYSGGNDVKRTNAHRATSDVNLRKKGNR